MKTDLLGEPESPPFSVRDVLTKALALIEKPENWCKFQMAKDASGGVVNTADPRACRFCAMGAIRRVAKSSAALVYAERKLARAVPAGSISQFNDTSTHADVVALFRRAIEATP